MRLSLSLAQRVFVRPRIAFLLCALTFSQMSSAQNASMLAQGGDTYTKAMAAYQGGDYSLAAQLFEQAAVETPGTTEALLYAGRSFVRLQLYEKAEQAVSRIRSEESSVLRGLLPAWICLEPRK